MGSDNSHSFLILIGVVIIIIFFIISIMSLNKQINGNNKKLIVDVSTNKYSH